MGIFNKFKELKIAYQDRVIESGFKVSKYDGPYTQRSQFEKKFTYYFKNGNYDKSLSVLKKAKEYLEDDYHYNELFINIKERFFSTLVQKNDKELLSNFISNSHDFYLTRDDVSNVVKYGNVSILTALMENSSVRILYKDQGSFGEYYSSKPISAVDPIVLSKLACEHEKIDFLNYACTIIPEQKSDFYRNILIEAIEKNWVEGVQYITKNFKEHFDIKDYKKVADIAVKKNYIDVARHFNEIQPELALDLPKVTIEDKIKELREKNLSPDNKSSAKLTA
jgi:hypothetical protein